jgi:hypothetical protein
LKSCPSENPDAGGRPPWPLLGRFENLALPRELGATAFHPSSLPLPSAVCWATFIQRPPTCLRTEDCTAVEALPLGLRLPSPERASGPIHLRNRPAESSVQLLGAPRVLCLTLPALRQHFGFGPAFSWAPGSVVCLELKPCLKL